MKGDDVLGKARYEERDEKAEQVRVRSFHTGWISVLIVLVFLYIWRSIHDEPVGDIFMILFAQKGAVLFYEYVNMQKKKSYLVYGIINIIGFSLAFASLLKAYGVY